MSKDEKKAIIPDVIHDNKHGISYSRGRFLGKGGFAKCYEILDMVSNKVYAGKIVPKSLMIKKNMTQEITIHQSLHHKNIVGFHGFFYDTYNVYIVLELCRKRSMKELHERRKALTECETKYYMKQILDGVHYLHQQRIIHGDLKLSNLFLHDDLQVKIGDFGLAKQLKHDGEKIKTLCGTPNYIAPEILNKVGHSYEVDIWSTGCIMYILLVGKPPFEASSVEEMYAKIKQVQYKIPTNISGPAMNMISNILQGNPAKRPSVSKLLKDPFFTSGFLPTNLPQSCLTMAPRSDILEIDNSRKPLTELNINTDQKIKFRVPNCPFRKETMKSTNMLQKKNLYLKKMLCMLKEQLSVVLKSKPLRENVSSEDELMDPNAQPFIWISKWVDYSDKCGFGYQLSDGGIGVMYTDETRLIMLTNAYNIHYINREGIELYYNVNEYPSYLEQKMKLMDLFLRYMNEHLMKAGRAAAVKQTDSLSRIPYLHQWFKTQSSVIMHLSNGTVQINFPDHTKIIMCPLMAAVTYIDQEKNFRTYRFQTIEKHGCCQGLFKNLQYAYEKLSRMISN